MVELTTTAAVAVGAGAGGLVLLLVLVVAVRAHRRTVAMNRRLNAVMARLEEPGARLRQERDSVGRLEQLAEGSVLRRVEAEAARARLAGALGAVGHGVVVCDETGMVVFRNGAAGAVEDETIDEALRAALAGEHLCHEVELFGSPSRCLAVSGHPLDDGARPVGAVVVVEDRSEGRRADALRRHLLANLTAELRGPVAALDLLAGTIATDLATGEHPHLAGRLAPRLAADARRVCRVIDDVAELSELEAGVGPPADPVPVRLLVAQAVDGAMAAATVCGVAVTVSPPRAALNVVGDRRHLVSALRHLIENAVQSSPADAAVTVQVGTEEGWVLVVVAYEGLGIAHQELDLGLAIASGVAVGHGGELLVDSVPGQGSVFTLKLPAGPDPSVRVAS